MAISESAYVPLVPQEAPGAQHIGVLAIVIITIAVAMIMMLDLTKLITNPSIVKKNNQDSLSKRNPTSRDVEDEHISVPKQQ